MHFLDNKFDCLINQLSIQNRWQVCSTLEMERRKDELTKQKKIASSQNVMKLDVLIQVWYF